VGQDVPWFCWFCYRKERGSQHTEEAPGIITRCKERMECVECKMPLMLFLGGEGGGIVRM
jgi:rubredoxin